MTNDTLRLKSIKLASCSIWRGEKNGLKCSFHSFEHDVKIVCFNVYGIGSSKHLVIQSFGSPPSSLLSRERERRKTQCSRVLVTSTTQNEKQSSSRTDSCLSRRTSIVDGERKGIGSRHAPIGSALATNTNILVRTAVGQGTIEKRSSILLDRPADEVSLEKTKQHNHRSIVCRVIIL